MSALLELQRRFASGDEKAFGALVEATTPWLFRLAVRLLGREAEVEDVLQESYLRAYAALADRSFPVDAALRAWLCRTVTNAALDQLRRRKRNTTPLPEPPARRDAERLDARDELRRLLGWIDELPPEQRAALVLKELEALTVAQVAEVLGCSEGAVEQRLVRARANLRRRSNDG